MHTLGGFCLVNFFTLREGEKKTMATSSSSSSLLSQLQIKGLPPLLSRQGNFSISGSESLRLPIKRGLSQGSTAKRSIAYCFLGVTEPSNNDISMSSLNTLYKPLDASVLAEDLKTNLPVSTTHAITEYMQTMVLGDLDPATAKLAIGILGPFLSVFAFLFILRIVMSWYPKLPVGKFPYVIAYVPTEPILNPTRKVIPPLGGVDVTPVVWFALISFLNEILLGPQGLLVLLSQQV